MAYFDYAAATPVDVAVLAAMQPFYADQFYNPSALYGAAKHAHSELEAARARVAAQLGTKPSEIIFTAGGTEANNLAIHGVMRHFPDTNMVISAIEHDAVRQPAANYPHHVLPVKPDGRVDIAKLEGLIDGRTVLVSVMLVNNEIGTIQPLREIAQIIAKVKKKRSKQDNPLPLYLHADACQAPNVLDIHTSRLGVDLMTLNGGKIYGPKQSGALYVHSYVRLAPLIDGGGQERGLRNGTENVAQCVGFSVALEAAQAGRVAEAERLGALQQLAYRLITQQLPAAVINGSITQRVHNNVHITVPGQDNERLLYALDERGHQVATGSACSAASTEPSHVLTAIGCSTAQAQESLRLTFGRSTTETDVRAVIADLAAIVASENIT